MHAWLGRHRPDDEYGGGLPLTYIHPPPPRYFVDLAGAMDGYVRIGSAACGRRAWQGRLAGQL